MCTSKGADPKLRHRPSFHLEPCRFSHLAVCFSCFSVCLLLICPFLCLSVCPLAVGGDASVLELLLPRTSRKALKESSQSPLHCAAEGGHVQCLRLLLSRGLNVNHQLSVGTAAGYCDLRRSALYFAVSNGDPDCTRLLLAAGAKTELDPLRCLLVAVRSGRRDLVQLLLAAGADTNLHFRPVSNSRFPTVLQYCLKDEAMMRLLLAAGYRAQDCFQCCHQQGVLENQGEGPISVSPSTLSKLNIYTSWSLIMKQGRRPTKKVVKRRE